jgi:hypothetical protein
MVEFARELCSTKIRIFEVLYFFLKNTYIKYNCAKFQFFLICFCKLKVKMFKNDRFWTKKHVSLWALTGPTSSNFSCHFYIFFRKSTSYRLKIHQICQGFLIFYTGWKFGVLTENCPYVSSVYCFSFFVQRPK